MFLTPNNGKKSRLKKRVPGQQTGGLGIQQCLIIILCESLCLQMTKSTTSIAYVYDRRILGRCTKNHTSPYTVALGRRGRWRQRAVDHWNGRAHMHWETGSMTRTGGVHWAGRDPHRPPGLILEGEGFFSLDFLGYSGILHR